MPTTCEQSSKSSARFSTEILGELHPAAVDAAPVRLRLFNWRIEMTARRLIEASDPGIAAGLNMEKAAAYAISVLIVGFGLWILAAGLNSSAPTLWICAALIPIAIGLISAFGPT